MRVTEHDDPPRPSRTVPIEHDPIHTITQHPTQPAWSSLTVDNADGCTGLRLPANGCPSAPIWQMNPPSPHQIADRIHSAQNSLRGSCDAAPYPDGANRASGRRSIGSVNHRGLGTGCPANCSSNTRNGAAVNGPVINAVARVTAGIAS